MPAAEGALVVLQTRLDEMLSFRDAALDWSDPEGIHDMRVATRRLRSITRDFGRYLPKVQLKKFRRGVKRLADALGEVRDEDVALAAIEESARLAPPELFAGFERVAAPKRARRKRARVQLFGALEAETFAGFGRELSAFLKQQSASEAHLGEPVVNQSQGEKGGAEVDDSDARARSDEGTDVVKQTFSEAGCEIIKRHLRQIDKLSVSLFSPHDSEGLHDLRIAAKELRYSLELFSACLGGGLKPFAKEIARLQSSLGHVHDCDGWIKELGKWLAAQNDQGVVDSSPVRRDILIVERRAALWLFRRYAAERAEHHAAALARWHAWENYKLLWHIRGSLSPGGPDEESETQQAAQKVTAAQSTATEGQNLDG